MGGMTDNTRRGMMKARSILVLTAWMAAMAQAETVISLDASAQVNGTDFTTHYGGGISNQANVVFGTSGGGFPAITNGQVAGATTYNAPDVYVVASRGEFTGNFGVGNSGASGWRIRLNSSVTDGGRFFSDNLFAAENVSFDAANDTLDVSELFVSDMAAVSNGTVRFVLRDNGQFYISESMGELQTGALDGNLSTNFSIEALSANWFEYDPAVNPATSGIADIGVAASPAFTNIDFIGFHMELTTAANGTIGPHNGCNFGVRKFTAKGVAPAGSDPWVKLEYWDFDADAANQSFGANWINAGSLGSEWNFGGPGTIATDGAGSLVVSNHPGQVFRRLPKAGTANADAGSDVYAEPFTSGVYRLAMDFSSWDLPDGVNSGNLELRVDSGGTSIALIRLRVNTAGDAAWVQLMGKEAGVQKYNTYGQGSGSTNKSTATSAAIEFDFDNDTIEYFIDGSSMKTTNVFNEAGFDQITFTTDAAWSSNNIVVIDAMGLSKYVEPAVTNDTPTSLWEGWIATYPGVGANSNRLDNGDSDPFDNLTEYAWGGDPSDGNDKGYVPAQSQVSDGGTNYLQYVYFERTDAAERGLDSILSVGTDLVFTNWADGSSYEVGSGASGIAGFNAVTNRIPTDAEVKQFIRLQIEFTP
jgi:hypothetical protein